jgi:hypothetical protein
MEDDMNEVFSVHSLVRDFVYQGRQYEEVKVSWFVVGRAVPLVPYETAIEDFARLDANARAFPAAYIDEQFGRDEAAALKQYLDRRPEVATRIEAIELPVMANASGCRRLERGGGSDFLILHREKGYPLPFKVEGYFSVRFAEPKVSGDDRATVINRRPEPSPARKKN